MRYISILLIILNIIFSSPGNIFSRDAERNGRLFISVNDVRLLAARNNLDIKLARLDAKIKGTELSYKESVFDTILNGELNYTDDQREQSSSIPGTKNITYNYNIGIDKKLGSGTDVEIDWTNKREWTNSSFVSTNPYHESEIAVSLTQPVAKNFFGLIDRGNIEIVKWEIKNAELDSYIKIEDGIILSEKAYWELVLAEKKFEIKKQMFKRAIQLFNQHRKNLKIGLVETGDVLASEANMHVRASDLLMALNELKTAAELLKLRLNLDSRIRLFPADPLPGEGLDTDFTESLTIAFANRRDYLSRKNDIETENINLRMKTNSRFPEIDLKATFATNGIDAGYYRAIEGVFEDSNPEYSIGIEFKFPLENNKANSEYEKAALEKAKAVVNLQKTERQIVTDIDEKFRNMSVTKTHIGKMLRVENLQKGKLFQEEKRFKYGRSDSDTLIRYQEDLLNAKLMTQEAYFNYRISILDLLGSEDSYLKHIGLE